MMNHTSSPHESLPHQAGPRTTIMPMPLALLIVVAVAALALAQNATSQAVTPKDASTTSPKSASAPATRPAITIGYDTTRLTGPLRPDGTVDYLAAVNQQYSKGVTHENNAAVLILEAIDPKDVYPNEQLRQQILDQLKPAPQAKEKYFKPLDVSKGPMLSAGLDSAVKKAWEKKDYPELAQWLAQNELPLAKFVEASKRPRYYMPLVTKKPDTIIVDAVLPSNTSTKSAMRALVARANLAISEKRVADAWADLVAVHRLGGLMDQAQTLIGKLDGMAWCRIADNASAKLAMCPAMTAEYARQMLREYQSLPLPPTVASAWEGERFFALDCIAHIAKDPANVFPAVMRTIHGEEDPRPQPWLSQTSLDWDYILSDANNFHDRLAKSLAHGSSLEQIKALQAMDQELKREAAGLLEAPSVSRLSTKDINVRSQFAAEFLRMCLLPSIAKSRELEARVLAYRQLAILATALSLHKLENGSYPAALEGLSPKHLKAVPMDPFSDKPFIYKLHGTDFTLYSVGANGKDDGGKNKDNGDESGDDLVVTSDETVPSSESPGPGSPGPMHP